MAIELSTPEVIPAQESKTFNEVWLSAFSVEAPINGPCSVNFCLRKTRALPDGTKDQSPGETWQLIPNFFADMTDEEAQVMYAMVEMCKRRAGL